VQTVIQAIGSSTKPKANHDGMMDVQEENYHVFIENSVY
jgi:hypothetical protein